MSARSCWEKRGQGCPRSFGWGYATLRLGEMAATVLFPQFQAYGSTACAVDFCCVFLVCPLKSAMRFLRRYRYVLFFLAVLVVCSLLVIRQFLANQSAHVERREDFILLHEKGHAKLTERLYQRLVQEIPDLPDTILLDDLQRTLMLVDPKVQQPDNLIWKYHWAVKQHLNKRAERRVARAIEEAEQQSGRKLGSSASP
jgi:hypothetical protein